MPYSAEISRANPTCFLFLIDQSKSMRKPLASDPSRTKAQAVADAVNHLLYTLTLRCVKGNSILDRFHVGVIGYGAEVGPKLAGPLAGRDLVPIGEVARNPLRVESRLPPGEAQPVRFPVWFEPTADGNTPMCAALDAACNVLVSFLIDHPDCYPPVVVNITDGKPNDGNPEADAKRITSLSSTDGNVLLFNLHLSSESAEQLLFPSSESELSDAYARFLFRVSSALPPAMLAAAREVAPGASAGARGLVFNADISGVVQALDIGTRVTGR